MKAYIEKLIAGQDLKDAEMEQAFDRIMSGSAHDTQIGAFLVVLRAKGETPSEIASAVRSMWDKAVKVNVNFDVVDTCGTGGTMHSPSISPRPRHSSWRVLDTKWPNTGTAPSARHPAAPTASRPSAFPSTSVLRKQGKPCGRKTSPSSLPQAITPA